MRHFASGDFELDQAKTLLFCCRMPGSSANAHTPVLFGSEARDGLFRPSDVREWTCFSDAEEAV
jgi:hypothetical protein